MTGPARHWFCLLGWFIAYILAAILLGLWMAMAEAHAAERLRLQRGELEILARVVQAESTGEPAAGQRAVAWTVLNRMRRPEVYGGTVTRVILAPYQYAKPVPLSDNSEAYLRALLATVQVLLGATQDDSLGATHFLKCDMRRPPRWAVVFKRTVRIGQHCFHRDG